MFLLYNKVSGKIKAFYFYSVLHLKTQLDRDIPLPVEEQYRRKIKTCFQDYARGTYSYAKNKEPSVTNTSRGVSLPRVGF